MSVDRLVCGGLPGDPLHHIDGTHRTTPVSTRGRTLVLHERALRRHLRALSTPPTPPEENP